MAELASYASLLNSPLGPMKFLQTGYCCAGLAPACSPGMRAPKHPGWSLWQLLFTLHATQMSLLICAMAPMWPANSAVSHKLARTLGGSTHCPQGSQSPGRISPGGPDSPKSDWTMKGTQMLPNMDSEC